MNNHTVILPGGYRSPDAKDAALEKEVVFGKLLTAADNIKIESDAQSALEVQHTLLHIRAAITKFGNVRRMPVPLSLLLQLDETDREVLLEGYADFVRENLGERVAEEISEHEFKLAFGLEIAGEMYDVIELTPEPKPLTGFDEVKLERQHGTGSRRELALIARETVKLGRSEGGLEFDGEVTLETLERLNAYDFAKLRGFFAKRRETFRRSRKALQGNDK